LATVYKVYQSPNQSISITSYATTDNPEVGTWLKMSGVGSQSIQYGTYAGWIPGFQRMAITYDSVDGDSGAPVTTLGSNVKLYGMHTSNSGDYSFATPYHHLKTNLGLN